MLAGRKVAERAPRILNLMSRTSRPARVYSQEAAAAEAEKKSAAPGDSESAATPEGAGMDEVSTLKAAVAALEAERDEMKDRMMRALADAENTRRIAKRDVENERQYGVKKFALSMVEVADNLERALQAVDAAALEADRNLKALHEGVEMTSRIMQKSLNVNGIEKVDPMGEVFDPNFHTAVTQIPVPGQKPGTVAFVQAVGYKLHDRVLRAAAVGVVAKPPQ